jgi:putative endonuclease
MSRAELGKQGEKIAAEHLVRQGYTLVGANWRSTQGEFDLIARDADGDVLVFVEVKTRRGGIEAAFESINPRKRRILEKMAYLYLHENGLGEETVWRIDVIGVTLERGKPVVEHIQDAFDW